MKVMAEKIHDEHSLEEFYKVFNKLWHSGSNEDRSLAIHALELYNNDFDLRTWKFLKNKLNDIKSIDEAECIGKIISFFYIKYSEFTNELLRLSQHKNIWVRRISLFCYYHILKNDIKDITIISVIENNIHDKDRAMKMIITDILNKIGKLKEEALKRFILKNKDMPEDIFLAITGKMKYLRKIRGLKRLRG